MPAARFFNSAVRVVRKKFGPGATAAANHKSAIVSKIVAASCKSVSRQPFTCWISFAQRSSIGSVASAFSAARLTLTRTAPRSR
jgi:hypothetical protein